MDDPVLPCCAGQQDLSSLWLEQWQGIFWFMTDLAILSQSEVLWAGKELPVPVHAGSRNAWEPHITLSCLKDLIPQALQGYFG